MVDSVFVTNCGVNCNWLDVVDVFDNCIIFVFSYIFMNYYEYLSSIPYLWAVPNNLYLKLCLCLSYDLISMQQIFVKRMHEIY